MPARSEWLVLVEVSIGNLFLSSGQALEVIEVILISFRREMSSQRVSEL